MQENKCGYCKFYDSARDMDQEGMLWGACFRYPPVVAPPKKESPVTELQKWEFPKVSPEWSCGEFEEAPESNN